MNCDRHRQGAHRLDWPKPTEKKPKLGQPVTLLLAISTPIITSTDSFTCNKWGAETEREQERAHRLDWPKPMEKEPELGQPVALLLATSTSSTDVP